MKKPLQIRKPQKTVTFLNVFSFRNLFTTILSEWKVKINFPGMEGDPGCESKLRQKRISRIRLPAAYVSQLSTQLYESSHSMRTHTRCFLWFCNILRCDLEHSRTRKNAIAFIHSEMRFPLNHHFLFKRKKYKLKIIQEIKLPGDKMS